MPEYICHIPYKQFKAIIENSRENTNIRGTRILNAGFMEPINQLIIENEPNATPKPRKVAKNNLYCPDGKKTSTSLIAIGAYCYYYAKNDKRQESTKT